MKFWDVIGYLIMAALAVAAIALIKVFIGFCNLGRL